MFCNFFVTHKYANLEFLEKLVSIRSIKTFLLIYDIGIDCIGVLCARHGSQLPTTFCQKIVLGPVNISLYHG